MDVRALPPFFRPLRGNALELNRKEGIHRNDKVMMEDHSKILNRIRQVVRSQDETELEAIVGEVATFNFKNPVAEWETFRKIFFC